MKEQVTEEEKRELDRAREDRRTQQPYASEIDDRKVEHSKAIDPREEKARPEAK